MPGRVLHQFGRTFNHVVFVCNDRYIVEVAGSTSIIKILDWSGVIGPMEQHRSSQYSISASSMASGTIPSRLVVSKAKIGQTNNFMITLTWTRRLISEVLRRTPCGKFSTTAHNLCASFETKQWYRPSFVCHQIEVRINSLFVSLLTFKCKVRRLWKNRLKW